MSVKVHFLGTGASIPTKDRNLSSVVVRYDSELVMFDCGEGTQKQMSIAGLSLAKKMKIFISHMHGDHVLGLSGLMQSMALLGREKQLDVYGPRGITKFVDCVNDAVQFNPTFPLNVHEVRAGRVDDARLYEVHSAWMGGVCNDCPHSPFHGILFNNYFVNCSTYSDKRPRDIQDKGYPGAEP